MFKSKVRALPCPIASSHFFFQAPPRTIVAHVTDSDENITHRIFLLTYFSIRTLSRAPSLSLLSSQLPPLIVAANKLTAYSEIIIAVVTGKSTEDVL